MSSPTNDVLRDLGRPLDALGLGWYLFGAQAALLRGSRRLTADIDVTVLAGTMATQELVDALTAHGFQLRFADHDRFVERTRVIPLVHGATQMPVDVVLGGPGLEEHVLSRCERLELAGRIVRVPLAAAYAVDRAHATAGSGAACPCRPRG